MRRFGIAGGVALALIWLGVATMSHGRAGCLARFGYSCTAAQDDELAAKESRAADSAKAAKVTFQMLGGAKTASKPAPQDTATQPSEPAASGEDDLITVLQDSIAELKRDNAALRTRVAETSRPRNSQSSPLVYTRSGAKTTAGQAMPQATIGASSGNGQSLLQQVRRTGKAVSLNGKH